MPAAGHREIRRQQRRRRVARPRFFADRSNPMESLSAEEVFSRYRFRPDSIIYITGLIYNSLLKSRRNQALTPMLQVLTCLRYLATGCFFREVGDLMGVSVRSVGRAVRLVCRSIFALNKQFIKFPTGLTAMHTEAVFSNIAGFPKVLGCIDGTYIKLKRPQEHEEEFVNRKGYHSLNVQAICDGKYRFISMKGNMPGSVHDSRIWKLSALRQQFDAGMHNGFLIGDSGYPCHRYLMTPFLNPSTPGQQKFNKSLCRTRVTIEQTFGIWKQRFTCLQRGIRACPADVVEITGTCAVLHNIGIDRHDIVDFDYIFENHQHIHELNLQNTMPPQRDGTATRQLIVENFFS